jgi:thiol-disulfide isomerase/thioredoxin
MIDYDGKIHAPEFPEGAEWLNTDRPLSMRDLRGKVVLLDFWTYCCINCMHVVPDLKKLERKYEKELVVVGVHSAKFTTERDTENIRQAILRYGIEHPVINDNQMILWRQYGVMAWPTLFLINPAGRIVTGVSGEGIYDYFDRIISEVIEVFDSRKQIDRRTLKLKLERDRAPSSLLSFPEKVLADAEAKRLFIADSNHNRIVIVSLEDNSVKDVIGSGEEGFADGDFSQARFNHPKGMALLGNKLYIADTENHAIRVADLERRVVTTVAGTGQQARLLNISGPGSKTPLNSPWDLVLRRGALYIAMAGSHQIWRLDLGTGFVAPYAGSGREGRIDGPLREAALAQPSGITTDGQNLYFADSESSSIRSADLQEVTTIVGGDLFDFGDVDGRGLRARLQHPLGVAYHDGFLYVADTYNNKIKRVSLKDQRSEALFGTGEGGFRDGDRPMFDEPGGLSVAFPKLYIADTNNHLIRVADLKARRVETLWIKDVEKLRPRRATIQPETLELETQKVGAGRVNLTVELKLPSGYKLNPGAPSRLKVASSDERVVSFLGDRHISNPQFPLVLQVMAGRGQAKLTADLSLYYCEAGKESLCYFKDVQIVLPIRVEDGPSSKGLTITYKLPGR